MISSGLGSYGVGVLVWVGKLVGVGVGMRVGVSVLVWTGVEVMVGDGGRCVAISAGTCVGVGIVMGWENREQATLVKAMIVPSNLIVMLLDKDNLL
jgi:hypothetical protein